VLRAAGVEVPKVYDVSGPLRRHVDRLPPAVAAEIDTLVSVSRRLREERELAFYGDEETDTEAEALYARGDAEEALALARRVLTLAAATEPG
jgi:HEPN domain-containing protein